MELDLPEFYINVEIVKEDTTDALAQFIGFTCNIKEHFFDDGNIFDLVCLSGVLPIDCGSSIYNLPLEIWLPYSYPFESPIAYAPPPRDLLINVSDYIEATGKLTFTSWGENSTIEGYLKDIQDFLFGKFPLHYRHIENNSCETDLARPMEERDMNAGIDFHNGIILNGLKKTNAIVAERLKSNQNCYRTSLDVTPKGYILIINNIDFKTLRRRNGAHLDGLNIQFLFEAMGYSLYKNLDETQNLTYKQMKDVIKEFAKSNCHRQRHAIIVFISSHGDADNFAGTDADDITKSNFLAESEIRSYFAIAKLASIPKIFFLQSCRGDNRDPGLTPVEEDETDGCSSDYNRPTQSTATTTTIPTNLDFFICRATFQDEVVFRNPTYGSYFVRAICLMFRENAHDLTLSQLCDRVRGHISNQTFMNAYKMCPPCESTLTKDFYFNI